MGPLGWLSIGILIGVALSPWLGGAPFLPAALATSLAVLGATLRWPAALTACTGAALGWLAVAALPVGPVLDGPVAVQGMVVGAPTGRAATVSLTRVAHTGHGWTATRGRIQVITDAPLARRAPIIAWGVAGPLREDLPGAPDGRRAAARSRVRSSLLARAHASLAPAPPGPDPFARARHRGVLRALVLGDRRDVPDAVWRRLRRTGTAHLLAISGFHVGLVALTVGALLRAPWRAVAAWRPQGISEAPVWAVGAASGVAYAVAVGAPPSAWRAAALLTLVAAARILGREVAPLRLLAVVAAAQAVVDPAVVGTASYQLSHGAVAGLILVTPRLLLYAPPDAPVLIRWALQAMAVTVGATVGTLPAAAWWFQEVALTAPLANLVAGPVVAWGVAPLAATALFLPEPLPPLALALADALLDGLLAVLGLLDTAPWTPAVGPVCAALLLGALALPRNRWRAVALTAILARPITNTPQHTTLPGPAGTTFLVRADGRRALIDPGAAPLGVVRWLRRERAGPLDVLVCTASTRTRCGAAPAVVEAIGAAQVWIPLGATLPELRTAAAARGALVIEVPPGVTPAVSTAVTTPPRARPPHRVAHGPEP